MNSIMPGDIETEKVREMITAEQVLAMIPISRTTLARLEKEGLFPEGVLLTPHCKLWFLDDVVEWQRQLQDANSPLAQMIRTRLETSRKARRRKLSEWNDAVDKA